MTLALLAPQPSLAKTVPQRISSQQLERHAAEAQTPAEHVRIAQYYEAKAQDYLAQAHVHEAMIENFKADATRVNNKNQASTIGHCQYFVYNYKALAAKSERLAQMHEEMAGVSAPPALAPPAPSAATKDDMPGMDMSASGMAPADPQQKPGMCKGMSSDTMDCCCHAHK